MKYDIEYDDKPIKSGVNAATAKDALELTVKKD